MKNSKWNKIMSASQVPCYSSQLERLNNMPVMGSILKWTVPPLQGLTIRLRGNELSLESLSWPAYPHRTLRQIEEEECQHHELYCDDQRWDSNSCCDHHMLGDILFSTQLLASHLVATFSVDDHHDSHGRYAVVPRNKMSMFSRSVWPDRPSKQTEREWMLILLFVAFCCYHMPSILQECRDYHRQKMSWPSEWSRVGC